MNEATSGIRVVLAFGLEGVSLFLKYLPLKSTSHFLGIFNRSFSHLKCHCLFALPFPEIYQVLLGHHTKRTYSEGQRGRHFGTQLRLQSGTLTFAFPCTVDPCKA